MNKMSALKQKCLLEELTKHVNKSYIGFYNAYQLTKNSCIESFEYKNKHIILLRVNATAILLAKLGAEITIQRVCEEHCLNKESSRAIRKFCYKFNYKTFYKNGIKSAPKWDYIKEHLLNYVMINPLDWSVDLI